MPHDIDDTWDRIEAWLRTNAPASDDHLGVPARRDAIPPVATLVGEPLLKIAACDDSELADLADLAAEPAGSPCWNGCVTQWYEADFATMDKGAGLRVVDDRSNGHLMY